MKRKNENIDFFLSLVEERAWREKKNQTEKRIKKKKRKQEEKGRMWRNRS